MLRKGVKLGVSGSLRLHPDRIESGGSSGTIPINATKTSGEGAWESNPPGPGSPTRTQF
jgi:hypothetical protein